MSFNICRGTLGSLAMFTARRMPCRAGIGGRSQSNAINQRRFIVRRQDLSGLSTSMSCHSSHKPAIVSAMEPSLERSLGWGIGSDT